MRDTSIVLLLLLRFSLPYISLSYSILACAYTTDMVLILPSTLLCLFRIAVVVSSLSLLRCSSSYFLRVCWPCHSRSQADWSIAIRFLLHGVTGNAAGIVVSLSCTCISRFHGTNDSLASCEKIIYAASDAANRPVSLCSPSDVWGFFKTLLWGGWWTAIKRATKILRFSSSRR